MFLFKGKVGVEDFLTKNKGNSGHQEEENKGKINENSENRE